MSVARLIISVMPQGVRKTGPYYMNRLVSVLLKPHWVFILPLFGVSVIHS